MNLWKVALAGGIGYWAYKKGVIQYDPQTKALTLHMDALKSNASQVASQAIDYTKATAQTVEEQVATKAAQAALPGSNITQVETVHPAQIINVTSVPAQSAFSHVLAGLGDDWGRNRLGWR